MAVEVGLRAGSWIVCASVTLPQELDDAIQKCHYDLYNAARTLNLAQLLDQIPMSCPMMPNFDGCPLRATYTVRSGGRNHVTEKGWV